MQFCVVATEVSRTIFIFYVELSLAAIALRYVSPSAPSFFNFYFLLKLFASTPQASAVLIYPSKRHAHPAGSFFLKFLFFAKMFYTPRYDLHIVSV